MNVRQVEYKIVSIGLFQGEVDEVYLNKLGKEGWILAAIGPNGAQWNFWRYKDAEPTK